MRAAESAARCAKRKEAGAREARSSAQPPLPYLIDSLPVDWPDFLAVGAARTAAA